MPTITTSCSRAVDAATCCVARCGTCNRSSIPSTSSAYTDPASCALPASERYAGADGDYLIDMRDGSTVPISRSHHGDIRTRDWLPSNLPPAARRPQLTTKHFRRVYFRDIPDQ